MSYETAPSTILLATHCCACNRPLRDAESVEAGMGPDCREKYGYACAQGTADWSKVSAAMAGLNAEAFAAVSAHYGDAHKMANVLVHRAACESRDARIPFVELVAALGFVKLATKLAEAAGEVVEITRDGDTFAVFTPYNASFVDDLKSARIGARWAKERKAWTVPADDHTRAVLWSVVKRHYAGAMLASAKGLTRIAA